MSLHVNNPQGAFPNQLFSALIRGNRLFLPNIGASPAPPVQFTANVQALVHVVDTSGLAEQTALHANLNNDISLEAQPTNPTASLGRLFGNDVVAIDANAASTAFLVVSRGGNYVMRASADANGRLGLGAPNVVRLQAGNLPNGVAMSRDGRRPCANNEANVSVTAMDLTTNAVLIRDIPAGEPPVPGTFAHAVLLLRYETTPDQIRYSLVEAHRMLYAHPKVDSASARIRFIGFDSSSLTLEVFSYVMVTDYGEYLEVAEDLNLRIMDIVAASGSSFALPSQTTYIEEGRGLDPDRTRVVEAQVNEWRERRELWLPRVPRDNIAEIENTLEYPAAGSATEGGRR